MSLPSVLVARTSSQRRAKHMFDVLGVEEIKSYMQQLGETYLIYVDAKRVSEAKNLLAQFGHGNSIWWERNPLRPRLTPYTGRKLPRANPGYEWHRLKEGEAIRAADLAGEEALRPGYYLGKAYAHQDSRIFSATHLGPNPLAYGPTGFRPPRAWFRKMMENVARGYRKPSAMTKDEFIRAVARIVGGIWARFDQKTRNAILRKYEGG